VTRAQQRVVRASIVILVLVHPSCSFARCSQHFFIVKGLSVFDDRRSLKGAYAAFDYFSTC